MPVEIGQPAPTFTLPAANQEGDVSLSDYRGKSPVLLALFRGLYCPFCRHQIARLAVTADKLRESGVETLGVVATPAQRARLYFRFRQARIPLAADADLTTHRAYGVPGMPLTPELGQMVDAAAVAYGREHGVPVTPGTAHRDLNALDGYVPTEDDQADFARHQAQFIGQFLVDRDGIVRWVNIERAPGEFPSEADLLATVRSSG
jgi:peroxiredoxin